MKGPPAKDAKTALTEGKVVRWFCYVIAGFSALWLMVALSAGGAFSAPLVGALFFGFFSLTMYLKEQEAEQNREAIRARQGKTAQQANPSRWDVDDSDPTQPPKILES